MTRVLLVKDNEIHRDLLSPRLRWRGFDVLIAADGEQGVAMAAAKSDLIVMDMSLPILEGWEATRRLKTAPDTAWIPSLA